ncbi:MAG: tRNA preQ1(34) S-adenosylmethionine ribosyltransferase-isomerase QueA [Gemmatimonadetes bacterium]|nr:tRNA preQ1(34) S-adenosylmethionine ribosyltransferase-isomerase QueA [Gemmatimonadota bacterium]
MSTTDFDYLLDPALIAQRPLDDRAASRLLVLHRDSGAIEHRTFRDFPGLLRSGDLLIRNTSRVIPARLSGTRDNGKPAEILLVHPDADGSWVAMVRPGGKLKAGKTITFGDSGSVEIGETLGGGLRRVRFTGVRPDELMRRHGVTPLPPYIDRPAEPGDVERYQTVYAREDGSVAAPTAGLHFDEATLAGVRAKGVGIANVVLHVGPGTFKPVAVSDPTNHPMHAEWYSFPPETGAQVLETQSKGGRVIAVGTTTARALESGLGTGWTDLFIHPPYKFKRVDALLTNFHLPRSTLLMLVAAFAGRDPVMAAYAEAVRARYRFYSYGDAMLVL